MKLYIVQLCCRLPPMIFRSMKENICYAFLAQYIHPSYVMQMNNDLVMFEVTHMRIVMCEKSLEDTQFLSYVSALTHVQ